MNAFLDQTKNIGDEMDYGQRKNNDIGEEVRLTLEIMERFGSPNAYRMIKFAIPPCKYFFIYLFLLLFSLYYSFIH